MNNKSTITSMRLSVGVAAMMAGMPIVCAFGGDPINMATGNFVYSKDDLTIPGRYPLSFKRFYNAIGGAATNLGQNWTHNFNIRLNKEDEAIHIFFGDGHVETYQKAAEGRYIAARECRNALIQTDNGWTLVSPAMETFKFDANGLLASISDVNGNSTDFTYADGLLVKAETKSGYLTFAYDEHLTSSASNPSLPSSSDSSLQQSSEQQSSEQAAPQGDSQSPTLTHTPLLTSISDHTGRKSTFTYTNNTLTKATHPTGAEHLYIYDNNGRLSELVNPRGITTVKSVYDNQNRVVKQYLPDGGIMSLSYDDKNKTTTFTQQDGSRVVYQRDDKFRTTGIVYEGVAGGVVVDDGAKPKIQETRVFGDGNEVLSKTDKNGNRTSFEYDKLSRLTKEINPLGHVTLIEYNNHNKPTKITLPNGGIVSLEHDNKGNVIGITDPLNRKTAFSCDETRLLDGVSLPDLSENKITYDDKGNVISITDATGATTLYEYDNLNRVIKTTNAEGISTAFEYDIMGNITKVTDALGNSRAYEYNISGKVTKITDFNGGIVEYKYNDIGKINEVIDQAGGVTRLTYDLVWNVTSVTDPAGNAVYYEYDSMGRAVKVIDQEGNVYEYAYDNNGNITAVTSPLGAITKIKYDALNRQEKITEPDGAVTELTYDTGGNVTHVKDPLGNVTKREYDLAGRMTKVMHPNGNIAILTYTALGKIETITKIMPDGKSVTQSYSYYPGGRLRSISLTDGEVLKYEYNKIGAVSKISDSQNNAVIPRRNRINRIMSVTGYGKGEQHGETIHVEYDEYGKMKRLERSVSTDETLQMNLHMFGIWDALRSIGDALDRAGAWFWDTVWGTIYAVEDAVELVIYALDHSVSGHVEYGVGIGGKFAVKGLVDVSLMLSANEHVPVGATDAIVTRGVDFAGGVQVVSPFPAPFDVALGIHGYHRIVPNHPSGGTVSGGGHTLLVSDFWKYDDDLRLSIGAALYFGFGGGFSLSFNATEFARRMGWISPSVKRPKPIPSGFDTLGIGGDCSGSSTTHRQSTPSYTSSEPTPIMGDHVW